MTYDDLIISANPTHGAAIVFFSSVNVKDKTDATGAFISEASAFRAFLEDVLNYHTVYFVPIDCVNNKPEKRKALFYKALENIPQNSLSCISMFCHGYASGVQFGLSKKDIPELVSKLAPICKRHVVLPLYCCSTADNGHDEEDPQLGTDGGFADLLRDGLTASGTNLCRVVAHRTAGHTTRNPHVVFFDGDGTGTAQTGGVYPVSSGGRLWGRWRLQLEKTFRFLMPFLEIAEIHKYLDSKQG